MPTLKDFGGFAIVMYFRDHKPPHVHVVTPDESALVAIADCAIFAGTIDAKFREDALDWIANNRAMLMTKWAEYQR